MGNLEIARVFNEEQSFRQSILESFMENGGNISIGYCIFAEDHEPLTEEQQKILDEHGANGVIELGVSINLDELIG